MHSTSCILIYLHVQHVHKFLIFSIIIYTGITETHSLLEREGVIYLDVQTEEKDHEEEEHTPELSAWEQSQRSGESNEGKSRT